MQYLENIQSRIWQEYMRTTLLTISLQQQEAKTRFLAYEHLSVVKIVNKFSLVSSSHDLIAVLLLQCKFLFVKLLHPYKTSILATVGNDTTTFITTLRL